jgi:general L-amino acid transport system permease protein
MDEQSIAVRYPEARGRGTTWLSLNNPHLRSLLFQAAVIGAVVLLGGYLVTNTQRNLDLRGIATGFGFLSREAGLPIADPPIAYSPTDTYGRALLIGFLNTLKVAAIGIVFATVVGIFVGVAQLSRNWLLARLSAVYVEVFRDVPLLLQLLFWYSLLRALPAPRQSLQPLPGVFLSNRGLVFPTIEFGTPHLIVALLMVTGAIAAVSCWQVTARKHSPSLQRTASLLVGLVAVILIPAFAGWSLGVPFRLDLPVLQGFNFRGGTLVSPEFFALLFGLVIYTAAFIAEIVRSGIAGVAAGQWEAGRALGLPDRLILQKIVMPQALRLIIPPLTSQYLNLTKNSSLAVAIGYQDIVSIANTTLNQTGQAIEGISIIMGVYLTISLSISLSMNWYNSRLALKGR